jgi:hypothetical protein
MFIFFLYSICNDFFFSHLKTKSNRIGSGGAMFKISGIEFNRNFIGIIIACLVFVLFCVIIQQVGIFKYKDALKEELVRPSPLYSLFYNSTTLDDLHVFIDNREEIGSGNLFAICRFPLLCPGHVSPS